MYLSHSKCFSIFSYQSLKQNKETDDQEDKKIQDKKILNCLLPKFMAPKLLIFPLQFKKNIKKRKEGSEARGRKKWMKNIVMSEK